MSWPSGCRGPGQNALGHRITSATLFPYYSSQTSFRTGLFYLSQRSGLVGPDLPHVQLVPLLETIEDLEEALEVMTTYLRLQALFRNG